MFRDKCLSILVYEQRGKNLSTYLGLNVRLSLFQMYFRCHRLRGGAPKRIAMALFFSKTTSLPRETTVE
jgi:hypothetical protein